MLTKMRNSKGFTLVELMIVVAIIGILAAVAIPYYQRYVAKARVTQLVIPAVHGIINGVTTYYGLKDSFQVIWIIISMKGTPVVFISILIVIVRIPMVLLLRSL